MALVTVWAAMSVPVTPWSAMSLVPMVPLMMLPPLMTLSAIVGLG